MGRVKRLHRKEGPLLLPIGSVESHGAHLPINTDVLIAEYIADEVAKRNSWISLPPIAYTISVPVRPSNVYVPPNVFKEYLRAIMEHFISYGQKYFVIILGHGGPEIKLSIDEVCNKLTKEHQVSIKAFHIAKVISELGIADTSKDKHAGCWETSMVLAINKELVKNIELYKSKEDLRKYGVSGDPLRASADNGAKIVSKVIEYIEKEIKKPAHYGEYYMNWGDL